MQTDHCRLTGLTPLLRLKTSDGFAYEETDPASVALEQNMLLSTILDWKISPLSQRYEEMCHQLQKGGLCIFKQRCISISC